MPFDFVCLEYGLSPRQLTVALAFLPWTSPRIVGAPIRA
jgi:hypothetical protein